jgi:hypothetical protein
MSLVDGEWFPSIESLQNNVSPAQNKTNNRYTSLEPMGIVIAQYVDWKNPTQSTRV